jgi:UTP-glucose-1-phosphate uridylyltransferase
MMGASLLRVTSYVEKPSNPLSNLSAVPIYVLSKASLTYLDDYIGAGYNTDALMSYLASLTTLYGWPVPGEVFDVGNPASYNRLLEAVQLQ